MRNRKISLPEKQFFTPLRELDANGIYSISPQFAEVYQWNHPQNEYDRINNVPYQSKPLLRQLPSVSANSPDPTFRFGEKAIDDPDQSRT